MYLWIASDTQTLINHHKIMAPKYFQNIADTFIRGDTVLDK